MTDPEFAKYDLGFWESRVLGELPFVRATYYRIAASHEWWPAMMQVLDLMAAKCERDGSSQPATVFAEAWMQFRSSEPHHRIPFRFFDFALRDLAAQVRN